MMSKGYLLFKAAIAVIYGIIAGPAFASDAYCANVEKVTCDVYKDASTGINFGIAVNWINANQAVTSEKLQELTNAVNSFKSVRLVLSFSDYASLDEQAKLNSHWIAKIDLLIEHISRAGAVLVIAMHRYSQLTGDPLRAGQEYIEPSVVNTRFISIWRQLAERYRGRYPKLIFELYNEPHGTLTEDKWNSLVASTTKAIRQVDRNRVLMVDAPFWANPTHLRLLRLPVDGRIIASAHAYKPMPFTHQGADWGSPRYPRGETCCTEIQRREIFSNIKIAADWSKATGVPVYIGEFGSIDLADISSRANFARESVAVMRDLNLSWAYWEYGGNFALFNVKQNSWNKTLMEALQ